MRLTLREPFKTALQITTLGVLCVIWLAQAVDAKLKTTEKEQPRKHGWK